MLKPNLFLGSLILISSIGFSSASPLDAPDIVYIDGLPCNSACQSYMAWSRGSPNKSDAVSQQPVASQSPRAEVQHKADNATKKMASARVANEIAPTPKRAPRTQRANLMRENAVSAAPPSTDMKATRKSASNYVTETQKSPEPITSSPAAQDMTADAPRPEKSADQTIPSVSDTRSGSVETSEPVATTPAAQDPAPGTPRLEQQADNGTHSSASSIEPDSHPGDVTAALGPPSADQAVAILFVRDEIKSASDLANKVVAVDGSQADSVPRVRAAIASAGAPDVHLSQDKKLALVRVMDGEVPAGVVTVVSAEEAGTWKTGVPGFNFLRLPLAPSPHESGGG